MVRDHIIILWGAQICLARPFVWLRPFSRFWSHELLKWLSLFSGSIPQRDKNSILLASHIDSLRLLLLACDPLSPDCDWAQLWWASCKPFPHDIVYTYTYLEAPAAVRTPDYHIKLAFQWYLHCEFHCPFPPQPPPPPQQLPTQRLMLRLLVLLGESSTIIITNSSIRFHSTPNINWHHQGGRGGEDWSREPLKIWECFVFIKILSLDPPNAPPSSLFASSSWNYNFYLINFPPGLSLCQFVLQERAAPWNGQFY